MCRYLWIFVALGLAGTLPAYGEEPKPPDIDALRGELHSDNPERQIAAAKALAALGEKAAPAAADLVQLLDAPSIEHQNMMHVVRPSPSLAAMDALLKIGPAASEALAGAFTSDKAELRYNAVYVLTHMDPEKTSAALKLAASDISPAVRVKCMEAMSSVSTKEAVALRILALTDSDENVRLAAASGFRKLPPATSGPGRPIGSTPMVGPVIVDQVVEALKPVLAHDAKIAIRIAAAKSLGELRHYDAIGWQASVDPLLQALKDKDSPLREAAATALGRLAHRRAVPALLASLADKEPNVVVAAVGALGEVGDPLATKSLIPLLRYEQPPAQRAVACTAACAAAQALGKIGNHSAVPALIEALQGRANDVAAKAAEALGNIGDARAVNPLLDVLRTREIPGEDLLKATATALGQLRDPRAVQPLVDAWLAKKISNHTVAAALQKISHPSVVVALADAVVAESPSQENPFHADMAGMLVVLTGRGECYNYDSLKEWWAANRERYVEAATDERDGETNGETTTPVKKP